MTARKTPVTPGSLEKLVVPVEIDVLVEAGSWPDEDELARIARSAVAAAVAETAAHLSPGTELSMVFTDDAHIRILNAGWRDKDKPTNVLSFPAAMSGSAGAMLGDIVLAEETVSREAGLEDKPFEHHLTHLIIHGFLHLLGYDHETETETETEAEAEVMEAVERRALARLAIPDPYA